MGLGGCYSCIKYLMFAFNFLFWLLGCAILGVGIWIRVDHNLDLNFAHYMESENYFNILFTAAYILIAVGVIIMVIGFLGCCGAIRESQCMLGTFFIFLFVLFSILLGTGIWAIVSKETMEDWVKEMLDTWVKNYYNSQTARYMMDNVQQDFNCCGSAIGSEDYGPNPELYPHSCVEYNWTKPCLTGLFEFFADHAIIIAGAAIGIAIVLILGMVFSMLLCCAIRDTQTRREA